MVFISNKNFDNRGDFSPAIWSSMIPAIKQRCAIMPLSFERQHVVEYTLGWRLRGRMLKDIRFKGGEKGDLMLSLQQTYEVLHCGAEGWTSTPSSPRGVVRDALAFYFLDATIASAFVARWCRALRVEILDGVYRLRDDEPTARVGAGLHKTP